MLSNAILSCLCYFGAFGYMNDSPTFTNNVIQLDAYYNINKVQGDEVQNYHTRAEFTCDFAYVQSSSDVNEYNVYVAFKEVYVRTWHIVNTLNDHEEIVGSSNNSFIGFDDCVLDHADNHMGISASQWSTTSTGGQFYVNSWFYSNVDDDEASASHSVLLNGSSSGTFRSNQFKVDLTKLAEQVKNAFNSQNGGYSQGYAEGYYNGNAVGTAAGYQTGYAAGYAEGTALDSTAFTIFNGILNIGMIPINFFLAMFDFTILGINISNFVMSVLSVFVTIWLIRMLTGKKTDGN